MKRRRRTPRARNAGRWSIHAAVIAAFNSSRNCAVHSVRRAGPHRSWAMTTRSAWKRRWGPSSRSMSSQTWRRTGSPLLRSSR
jgi:hypothetical protein